MGKTSIEWTVKSWNPIRARRRSNGKIGWHCEHVNHACRDCYAEGINRRLGTGLAFKPGHRDEIEILLDNRILQQPFGWYEPDFIFPCSMTDWLADFVPDHWVAQMVAVMANTRHLTFQCLTKRHDRQRQLFNSDSFWDIVNHRSAQLTGEEVGDRLPSNVWLGVSCGDQADYDAAMPNLQLTPAAKHWISFEPMLGFINPGFCQTLDWAVIGGESGPNARPFNISRARILIACLQAQNVAVFVKQLGRRPQFPMGEVKLKNAKGGDPSEWPKDLQIRDLPQ